MEAGIEAYRTWKRERKMKGLYGIEKKAERKMIYTLFWKNRKDMKRYDMLLFTTSCLTCGCAL